MAAIKFVHKGDFKNIEKFFNTITGGKYIFDKLAEYGERGVQALSAATPVDTGKTAASWKYEIREEPGRIVIEFLNTNVVKDYANVAILLQYGHATGTGGWVVGRDYINPALQPIFDELAKDAWEEVISK